MHAGARIALVGLPAKAAFGADQTGPKAVTRSAGPVRRFGCPGVTLARTTPRSLRPGVAPTLTHSPGLLSPHGGEWRAV